MHQVFECTKEEDVDIDDIDDHFPTHLLIGPTKSIADNLIIKVEVDGETIFEGSMSELSNWRFVSILIKGMI